jgi:hypothetical protein
LPLLRSHPRFDLMTARAAVTVLSWSWNSRCGESGLLFHQ